MDIAWVRECISTASANVLVNGSPSGEFCLGRGIHQGDPFSHFLFLVAAEGLNLLMRKALQTDLLQAVLVGSNKVEVSHLQYADDIIFTVKGTPENARALKWLLKNFEVISGLRVNFEKSCTYGVNVGEEGMAELAGILGCKEGNWPLWYLGLQVGGMANGVGAWRGVLDKVSSKLGRWDSKSISMGGRITIIKSILSAIPLYNLSFSRLPKMVEKQLKSRFCQFLWRWKDGEKNVAWVGWENICKSFGEGGLGIKNLEFFNRALLAKWIWKFLVDKECL